MPEEDSFIWSCTRRFQRICLTRTPLLFARIGPHSQVTEDQSHEKDNTHRDDVVHRTLTDGECAALRAKLNSGGGCHA